MKLSADLVFYIFAFLGGCMAINVVVQNNPVRSVLSLVATFFCTAVLWLLQEAEFLSLILVLVYVGAVMTLFLFVVMMLNIDQEAKAKPWKLYIPVAVIMILVMLGILSKVIPKTEINAAFVTSVIDNTTQIGLLLYTKYTLAFQLAAVLLLIAMISAITLVHRGTRSVKVQNIRRQVQVNAACRVELVKVTSTTSEIGSEQ